jgi:hypothetical protein
MTFLVDLWMPIRLAAVHVFVASSILHMVLPMHKSDYKQLPGETEVLDVLRAQRIAPGAYMFPRCGSMKDMAKPETIDKYRKGPVGTMVVIPNGPPAIGKALIQWFVFCLVVGLFVAYLSWFALAPGAEYLAVFRISGTAALLGYALNSAVDSIWKGLSWSITLRFVVDGIVYALVTAGSFAALWPAVG